MLFICIFFEVIFQFFVWGASTSSTFRLMLFKVKQSPCSGSLLGGGGRWGLGVVHGVGHLFVWYFSEILTILLDEG